NGRYRSPAWSLRTKRSSTPMTTSEEAVLNHAQDKWKPRESTEPRARLLPRRGWTAAALRHADAAIHSTGAMPLVERQLMPIQLTFFEIHHHLSFAERFSLLETFYRI